MSELHKAKALCRPSIPGSLSPRLSGVGWCVVCPGTCVHPRRPSRLPGFSYVGHHRYFLTICALRDAVALTTPAVAADLLSQLRQRLEEEALALLAYCIMKDHIHLVLEGLSETSDLRRLVSRWKQATGYHWKQETGHGLWMKGFYDRVLRDGESTLDTVRYVLSNPVKAGLASRIGTYEYAGSDVFSQQELEELLGP